MRLEVLKSFTFDACHRLPNYKGKCANLHGHTWKLVVGVSGEVDEVTGFVVDFAKLRFLVEREILEQLDHAYLGQGNLGNMSGLREFIVPVWGEDFLPTCENLVAAIARLLQPWVNELSSELDRLNRPKLTTVELYESASSKAVWRKPC